ncbi:MAG TPA: HAD family hydrolase [Candidatus Obscuribacter sp.]|nr:HAD family hydrolase [Candidatus Obscuribacter sp.]MBK9280234.1 HAD family hydrolase [Candidatus Obscuribacter sp.]MBL8083696.1 HAD family hydrolase [Candidatus Obscuribacter sp.]HMW91239.1 HAD family hydrolase [Candidatus Obscuribacter sp.]HMX45936.1 HAD family hydrolase [Candidatus Obscuribacter sp.]
MDADNCLSSALARPLLILDLDETLVLTVEKPLDRPADFRLKDYHVYFRPHLKSFLTRVQAVYDVAVWSAGGSGYVEPTVAHLFQELAAPVFVWSYRRCTRKFDHESHEEYFIKDLKKVYKKGFPRERMLIVDDLERNCLRNYGSAVYVRAFDGSLGDDELLQLAAYLEALAPEPNFRTVEKRYWRKRASHV